MFRLATDNTLNDDRKPPNGARFVAGNFSNWNYDYPAFIIEFSKDNELKNIQDPHIRETISKRICFAKEKMILPQLDRLRNNPLY